jgi:hypothetical protein
MPDLEELIRRTLRDQEEAAPANGDVLTGARARLRRRHTGRAIIGVALITTAAVVVPLAVISHERSTLTGSGPTPPSRPLGQDPGVPLDPMFTAAPPMLNLSVHGPAGIRQPRCSADQIDATAQLRRFSYGVAGVIELRGQNCSIPMYSHPAALASADGRLDVPATTTDQVGENVRPDLAFDLGKVALGFAWTGSWCGPTPTDVVVALTERPNADPERVPSLTVPMTGPALECDAGSDSSLILGAPGRIGDPVLPPSAAWSALTARLIPAYQVSDSDAVFVELSNDTDADIVLDPCPEFRLVVDRRSERAITQSSNSGLLPCDTGSIVPAHGQLHLRLPSVFPSGAEDLRHGSGDLTFGIAGGVTAHIELPLS